MKCLLYIILLTVFTGHCFGQALTSFQGIEKDWSVKQVQFSGEKELLSLFEDGRLAMVNTDSLSTSFPYGNLKYTCFDYCENQGLTVCGDKTGVVRLFKNNEKIWESKSLSSCICAISFSCGGEYCVSSTKKDITVWSMKSQQLLMTIPVNDCLVTALKFSLDNKRLVYVTSTGNVVVWNIENNEQENVYDVNRGWLRCVEMCPDGLHFAVSGDNGEIVIFSLVDNNHYQLPWRHKNWVTDIRFINENYLLAIDHNHQIVMHNINAPKDKKVIRHFNGYPRYQRYFNAYSGDKYLSSLDIIGKFGKVAVSSFGKGVMITDFFHQFIAYPHDVRILKVGRFSIGEVESGWEHPVNKKECTVKCEISRSADVRSIWLYNSRTDNKVELQIDAEGIFYCELLLENGANHYRLIINDWDENLEGQDYEFTLIKKDKI
ncbi:hypothetical protein EYV94_14985 [Puteibacter caeruleilacunae]|nr:hypothetical protein EYV94_14985 [Puteibacter caeruleilacunae]